MSLWFGQEVQALPRTARVAATPLARAIDRAPLRRAYRGAEEQIVAEREMKNDIDYLTKLWADLTAKSGALPVPSPIYQDLSLAQRVLRDMVSAETVRVLVDSRENHQKLVAFAQRYMPQLAARIEHYAGERPSDDKGSAKAMLQHGRVISMRGGKRGRGRRAARVPLDEDFAAMHLHNLLG